MLKKAKKGLAMRTILIILILVVLLIIVIALYKFWGLKAKEIGQEFFSALK